MSENAAVQNDEAVAGDGPTPGPWAMLEGAEMLVTAAAGLNGGSIVCRCNGPDQIANARRIAACVNAMKGVPTAEVERMAAAASSMPSLAEWAKRIGDRLKTQFSVDEQETLSAALLDFAVAVLLAASHDRVGLRPPADADLPTTNLQL